MVIEFSDLRWNPKPFSFPFRMSFRWIKCSKDNQNMWNDHFIEFSNLLMHSSSEPVNCAIVFKFWLYSIIVSLKCTYQLSVCESLCVFQRIALIYRIKAIESYRHNNWILICRKNGCLANCFERITQCIVASYSLVINCLLLCKCIEKENRFNSNCDHYLIQSYTHLNEVSPIVLS